MLMLRSYHVIVKYFLTVNVSREGVTLLRPSVIMT